MTDDLISRAAAIAVAERAELDWADPSWTLEQLRALPAAQVQAEPVAAWRMALENAARMAEQGILSMDGGQAAVEIRALAPDRAPTPPAPDDLDALIREIEFEAVNSEIDRRLAGRIITALRARPATVQAEPVAWEKPDTG